MLSKNAIKTLVKPYVAPIYERVPGWCFPKYRQRFQAYGVGLQKTGTTSLHEIFSLNYRSAHEPESNLLVLKKLALVQKDIDKKEFIESIKRRERRLSLEMNSSSLNSFIVEVLSAEFEDAKFILTIRDCYSWLDSVFNHRINASFKKNHNLQSNRPKPDIFQSNLKKWRQLVYKTDQFNHAPEEQLLAEKGLYPLDRYLFYYKERHNHILQTIPPERLLIIRTPEINQSIPKIAQFLDIPPASLRVNVRANMRRKADKYHLLTQLDRDFVRDRVKFHCEELMCQYFPDVKF